MEDPKLVEYFKKMYAQAREQGYSERVIRESAYEASPKAKWHERAYMTIVEGASVSLGLTLVFLVILYTSYIEGSQLGEFSQLYISFLLLLPGGLLYYFAISAFKHHAGSKFFMTLFVSVVLSLSAIIITNLYSTLLEMVSAKYTTLIGMVETAKSFGAEVPDLVPLQLTANISITELIIAIFLAYNIAPVVGYVQEHIKVKKK